MVIIRANFSVADLQKQIREYQKEARKACIASYKAIGSSFVTDARQNADFQDHTGNLRSSIVFLLKVDGKIRIRDYEVSQRGTDRITGMTEGLRFAESVAKETPNEGIVMIVTVGMDYAASVESKGRNVITGSSQTTKKLLRTYFKQAA